MATSTASLVVRILADIDSFKKGMSGAERELVKTSERMQSIGQKLSLSVTLPFLAMGAAFAKSAAEDEASVKKLEHTFGASAKNMEGFIGNLMKTVPATDDALRQLTSSTDVLLRSMGLGVPKATAMTQALTTLAGDLAAFNHVELGVAQNALEAALAGQTRGLKEFGVIISEADIKQRAYKLGLADTGDELTHAATAQASWSLILERTKQQQGEAARTIGEDANAMARLKQSADSVADSFGAVFLPTAAKVVGAVDNILRSLAALPEGTKGVIVGVGSFVAVIGPAIFIVGGLTEKVILLNRALKTLSGTSGLAGLTSLLGTLAPLAVILGAPLLASAFAFNKEGEAARSAAGDLDAYKAALVTLTAAQLRGQLAFEQSKLGGLQGQAKAIQDRFKAEGPSQELIEAGAKLSPIMAAAEARVAAVKAQIAAMGKAAKDTSDATDGIGDGLKKVEERAQAVLSAFELMKNGLAPIPGFAGAVFSALTDVDRAAAKIPNRFDPLRLKLEQIGQTIRNEIINPLNNLSLADIRGMGVQTTPADTRPIFAPTPGQIQIGGLTAPAPQAQKQPDLVAPLSNIQRAMQAGFQQVAVAIGDTLATRLATMFGGHGIGAQIGGSLGGAFGGGVGTVLGGVAAASIGGLIGAGVGSVIPVVGTLIGGALGSAIGGLFGSHKKSVDNSASSLDRLAKTVDKVTESITNIPQFFKVQSYRFEAAPTTQAPAPTAPSNPPQYGGPKPTPTDPSIPGTGIGISPDGGAGGSKSIVVHGDIIVQGVTDLKSLVEKIQQQTLRTAGTGNAGRLSFAGGIR